jgi:hypothetical protein
MTDKKPTKEDRPMVIDDSSIAKPPYGKPMPAKIIPFSKGKELQDARRK